eukprot:523561-Rhodomonas_salina.1
MQATTRTWAIDRFARKGLDLERNPSPDQKVPPGSTTAPFQHRKRSSAMRTRALAVPDRGADDTEERWRRQSSTNPPPSSPIRRVSTGHGIGDV